MSSHNQDKQPLLNTYGTVNYRNQAQQAHQERNAELSRQVHIGKAGKAEEAHLDGGGYLKSAVYGGLDGIITTFATVTSVSGSGLNHSVILILGLAHLVADGMSMGLGDMLSSQAEKDLFEHERKREEWEFDNYPAGEIQEMVEVYESKGISSEDARLVVNTLSKYRKAFIDIMMVEELHILPDDDSESPLIGGLVTFASFMIFGSVPLFCYLVNLIPGINMSSKTTFGASCFLTVLTLFFLGAVKGKLVGQSYFIAGCSMAFNGSVAAGAGWVIGFLLQLTGIQNIP